MRNFHQVIRSLFFSTLVTSLTLPALSFADEDISSDSPPAAIATDAGTYYPNGCIPNVSLPVYPEAHGCAYYYSTFDPSPYYVDSASDTSTDNVTTTTSAPTTSTSTSSSGGANYYTSAPTYVYPQTYDNTASGVFLGLASGLAIGGLIYAANQGYPYYGSYSNNYYNNYYNYNNYNYYNRGTWQGAYGDAGYYHGPNGGAYYWTAGDYKGGGYCYQGSCQHNNNWDNTATQHQNTMTTNNLNRNAENRTQQAQTLQQQSSHSPRNVSTQDALPHERFQQRDFQDFHPQNNIREGGFGGSRFSGFHGGRR